MLKLFPAYVWRRQEGDKKEKVKNIEVAEEVHPVLLHIHADASDLNVNFCCLIKRVEGPFDPEAKRRG